MLEIIKSTYDNLFKKEDAINGSYFFRSLISTFQNIVQYDLADLDTARIHTKDIITFSYKNKINYRKEDVYTVIKTESVLNQSISIKKELLKDLKIEEVVEEVKNVLEHKMIESIDKMMLFTMSELGRTTSSIYGHVKDSIGRFTISKDTTASYLIEKLEFADIVLKELNNIGLKHIIFSKSIYSKLASSIENSKIKINHKLITYQLLPEHLDVADQMCLIATSQYYDDSSPGIVMVYKNLKLDIIENETDNTVDFNLSKEYSIKKVGKKPEFFYLRFLQT